MCAFSLIRILVENGSDNRYFLRIDEKHTIFHRIAKHIPAKNHALFHAPLLSPLYTLRGFPALLLRQTSHNCQAQFAIAVTGINVVDRKYHAHTRLFEPSGIRKSIHRISCKTGNFFGQNQIEFPAKGILYHLIESVTFTSLGAADSLVKIYFAQLHISLTADIVCKITFLTG